MRHVLVANTKGGSGKTTLATNLAGYLAHTGANVALQDIDKQQSSTHWLARRPVNLAKIHLFEELSSAKRKQVDWLITDSPGGFSEKRISEAVKEADLVLVPIQPSAFDIGASDDFLNVLNEEKAIRKHKTFVGLVGMRVGMRTKSAQRLWEFMQATNFPIVGALRSAQLYVKAAEEGLSVVELKSAFTDVDALQWQVMMDWLVQASVNDA